MSEVKSVAIKRALALLNAAGAKYKVIAEDGAEYGELVVAPPKSCSRKPRDSRYASGERTAYIRALVADMKPGDEIMIPFTDAYPADAIGHMVAPTCFDLWGSGGYITENTEAGVSVLRVEGGVR